MFSMRMEMPRREHNLTVVQELPSMEQQTSRDFISPTKRLIQNDASELKFSIVEAEQDQRLHDYPLGDFMSPTLREEEKSSIVMGIDAL